MSDFAHPFPIIHYTQLSDLFQEVACPPTEVTGRLVRVEPQSLLVSRRAGQITLPLLLLGVLVTALNQDGHLLTAWLLADQYQPHMAPAGRKAQAEARQVEVVEQVKSAAQCQGLRVLPGYYAVPESAFRQVAVLSSKGTPWASKGGC
jgi:hypothetical protein